MAFSQPTASKMVLERQPGRVELHILPEESTVPSKRLEGGMATFVEAFARQLSAAMILLETTVTSILQEGSRITVTYTSAQGTVTEMFDRVLLALPPRLVVRIAFEPELTRTKLKATPTWMAGQAKAIAVYDAPFWREQGQSGFGIIWIGPLQEIHDATPVEGPGALFGLMCLTPKERRQLGKRASSHVFLNNLLSCMETEHVTLFRSSTVTGRSTLQRRRRMMPSCRLNSLPIDQSRPTIPGRKSLRLPERKLTKSLAGISKVRCALPSESSHAGRIKRTSQDAFIVKR